MLCLLLILALDPTFGGFSTKTTSHHDISRKNVISSSTAYIHKHGDHQLTNLYKPSYVFTTPEPPRKISKEDLNLSVKFGLKRLEQRTGKEKDQLRRKLFVKRGSSASLHNRFFRSSPKIRRQADRGFVASMASKQLMDNFRLPTVNAGSTLSDFDMKGTEVGDQCPEEPSCAADYPYRTFDGSCNNLATPSLGQTGSPYTRKLAALYADGIMEPRVAKSGSELPSARVVSYNIVPSSDVPSEINTRNVMQWGQFTDHDLTFTPLHKIEDDSGGEGEQGVMCCTEDGKGVLPSGESNEACFPIPIFASDPFFGKFGQRCMDFVRSEFSQSRGCKFGAAEQINQITHFHDSSNVYGATEEEAQRLREFRGGLLRVYIRNGQEMLPLRIPLHPEGCLEGGVNRNCMFDAGDERVNEQPGLTTYHTVWMREHNRLARELANINPHWNDEILFQEARRILVAEAQHITYNEWLPIILGKRLMEQLGIQPLSQGYRAGGYDPAVDPSVTNSFATAAFRFGHSLITRSLALHSEQHGSGTELLKDHFFNTSLVTTGKLDQLLVGLDRHQAVRMDNALTDQVTERLFETVAGRGMDLAALNIQRGRDHGLPGYNAFREVCGLRRARSFEDFADLVPIHLVQRMKTLYENVDDVDLFIGGISEFHAEGSILGPTFQCIVGEQFKALQYGDRFFYDSYTAGANPAPFSSLQLQEIRKATLARIHCDNGDNVKYSQPDVFRVDGARNPVVRCDSAKIPTLNLHHWKR